MTLDRWSNVAAMARSLVPPGVSIAAASAAAGDDDLWPEERAAMLAALPARRREFAAGRRAARIALADLGMPAAAIPMGPDRAPVWPAGAAGSITHTGDLALAAAAHVRDADAIGIDVETDQDLPADLVGLICRAEERRWARSNPAPLRAAMLLFVAKEAAYKCQYTLSGRLLDFDAIGIEVIGRGEVVAIFETASPPFRAGERLAGRYGRAEGQLAAAFVHRNQG